MTWAPDDASLDALARELPPPADRTAEVVEHERTSLLAQAAGQRQLGRRAAWPMLAAAGAAFAAAAAIVLWLVARPGAPAPKEHIVGVGPATFATAQPWPDFVVHVTEGKVDITVAPLAAGERFRAVTADAEVEVRGTRFTVAAANDRIAAVEVGEGRVEVRWGKEPAVFVAAGERWEPPRTAQRDELIVPPASGAASGSASASGAATASGSASASATATGAASDSATASATGAATATATATDSASGAATATASGSATATDTAVAANAANDASPARPTRPRATSRVATSSAATSTSRAATAPQADIATTAPKGDAAPAIAPAPRPGETEFRAGVASLRANDAAAAQRSFAAACTAARGSALAEDACFWVGAAAKRANDLPAARAALARFVSDFPSASRANEAAALLGWLLYDAGDLDGAAKQFTRAADDRVPSVRDSARRGLEAIKRTRER